MYINVKHWQVIFFCRLGYLNIDVPLLVFASCRPSAASAGSFPFRLSFLSCFSGPDLIRADSTQHFWKYIYLTFIWAGYFLLETGFWVDGVFFHYLKDFFLTLWCLSFPVKSHTIYLTEGARLASTGLGIPAPGAFGDAHVPFRGAASLCLGRLPALCPTGAASASPALRRLPSCLICSPCPPQKVAPPATQRWVLPLGCLSFFMGFRTWEFAAHLAAVHGGGKLGGPSQAQLEGKPALTLLFCYLWGRPIGNPVI